MIIDNDSKYCMNEVQNQNVKRFTEMDQHNITQSSWLEEHVPK
jgi:hypothetical protein